MSEDRQPSINSRQSRAHPSDPHIVITRGGSSIRFEDEVLSQQEELNFRDKMEKRSSIDRSISNGRQNKTLKSSKSSSLFNKYT
jgi:hypothetical protein